MANPPAIAGLQKDAPVVLDASFRFDKAYARALDNQVLAIEQHLLDSMLLGQIATWFKLSGSSAALVAGDCVCIDPTDITGRTVTKAVAAAVAAAGLVLGVVAEPATPGSHVRVVTRGVVAKKTTGLAVGAAGPVRLNGTTARAERVGSLSTGDYPLGYVDSGGNLSLTLERAVAAGGGGGGTNAESLRGVNLDAATVGSPATGAGIFFDGTDYKAALVDNAKVATGAGIVVTKLAASGGGADVLLSSGGSNAWGQIANAYIATGANISVSKLAIGGARMVLFSDGSTNPQWTASPQIDRLSFGAAPSVTGELRMHHNFSQTGRNQANTSNRSLLRWGVEANDVLSWGDDNVVATRYRAAGDHTFYRGGTAMFAVRDRQGHAFVEDNAGAGFDYGLKSSYHDDEVNGAHLVLQKSRGTLSAPTGVANGDDIASIIFSPRNGTDAAYDVSAGIVAKVIAAPGAGSVPTALDVRVGPTAGSLATIASFRTDHVVFKNSHTIPASGDWRVASNALSMVVRDSSSTGDFTIFNYASNSWTWGHGSFAANIDASGTGINLRTGGVSRLGVLSGQIDVQVATVQWGGGINGNLRIFPTATASVTGNTLTVSSQDVTGAGTVVGGHGLLRGGNATNTGAVTSQTGGDGEVRGGDCSGSSGTRIGGKGIVRSGVGATTDGDVVLAIGASDFLTCKAGANKYIRLDGHETATTVGAAGGASALPATPTAYLRISLGGTRFKIPYYAD